MVEKRLIVEIGMGNDMYGQDYTKAAIRAVESAIRRSSLPLFGAIDLPHEAMRVAVTIAVQEPGEVDTKAVAAHLPRGRAEVDVVAGGLNSTNPATGQTIVIATAAVEAFLPDQTGRWHLSEPS